MPKKTKPTVSKLKKKADQVFSIFIRQRDKGVCFTCGIKKPWKEMQAGHFVSRSNNSLRFSPINVFCQCVGCNVFKHGNMDEYSLRLVEKYGVPILKELNRQKHVTKQFTPKELQDLIIKYTALIK